jgi:large subunit ribosomal protein L10
MNRAEKAAEIELLKERFASSQIAILTDYRGLDVASITSLRRQLDESQTNFKVVKNRLAKIAVKDTSAEPLSEYFVGTTAVATSDDPTGPAKVLMKFAKDHEQLKIRIGLLDGKLLDLKSVEQLATMPSKDELIAKLMGSMQAPATNLVGVLSQIPRQVVSVLDAVRKQKELQA